jgi:alkanesulfonate monooxygenase SsuD/methylene tetrahydromethanopterin reductase-like flavin-dependent oxidoreductase (luciferase family)
MASASSVFLSAAVQRTHTLKLGPLVYLLPLQHPLRLLEEIGMLDQLSGGRFQLGVGRGGAVVEHQRFGLREEDLDHMFEEALDMLLKGLAGETLNYAGAYFRADDAPLLIKSMQQPHPPLWYGTSNPERCAWAARERVNLMMLLPAARTRVITDRFREEWAALGRAPEDMPFLGIVHQVFVAETDAVAHRIAKRCWNVWNDSFHYLWRRTGRAMPVPALAGSFEDMVGRGTVHVGSPETVRSKVLQLKNESGITYFAPELVFGDMREDEARRSVTLFAEEVMPAFTNR